MRIADKMQLNQTNTNVLKNRTEMYQLQNQAATQKRINKPSDDPLSSARVLAARTEERSSQQFVKNINYAKSFLEFSDQSLSELSEILMRAKELAISSSNDASANEESRRITASEIEQIHSQSIQIGNRKLGERYVFGGYQTQAMPFNSLGEYVGDDGDMRIQMHKDTFVAMNMPGSKVFLGKGIGSDGIIRSGSGNPRNVDELLEFREEDKNRMEQEEEIQNNFIETRGPASIMGKSRKQKDPVSGNVGINVFQTLKGLEIALRTNDKASIQDNLDSLDQAISQVVLARSELGSRVTSINNTMESLQKGIVDNKTMASQLEDVDMFELVSEINKSDAALRATLETSSKLIQPSLLDFLK